LFQADVFVLDLHIVKKRDVSYQIYIYYHEN